MGRFAEEMEGSGVAGQLGELQLLSSAIELLQGDMRTALAELAAELGDVLHLDDVTITVGASGSSGGCEACSPGPAAAGAVFVMPLRRAGTVVGELRARAVAGLSPDRAGTLAKVGALLALTIASAQQLDDEQEAAARLRALDTLKASILDAVSHELRTTVTAIEGFAMLLSRQSAKLSEDQRLDFVNRIRRNARSLGILVDDLLDVARLEHAGEAMRLQPVDLSDLIPKVVEQMWSILDRHMVTMDIAPDVSALADPGAVERIVVNLLTNAAKYTPPGTEILVRLACESARTVLSVADRGPGIPLSERTRIFERFYRINTDLTSPTRGVGIGLTLVRDLVDLQFGIITVDENPGGGARFTVELPPADAAPPA